jgi:hypothetical protein
MVANLPWSRTPIIFYSSLRNRKFYSARFEPLFSSTFTLPKFYSVLHFELLFSSSNIIRATAQLLLFIDELYHTAAQQHLEHPNTGRELQN